MNTMLGDFRWILSCAEPSEDVQPAAKMQLDSASPFAAAAQFFKKSRRFILIIRIILPRTGVKAIRSDFLQNTRA